MTSTDVARLVDSNGKGARTPQVSRPGQLCLHLPGEGFMPFRYAIIVTTLAVLALPGPAQKSNIRGDNNPEVVESAKKFEHELRDLIVRGEWEAYAVRLTDDYVRILPGKIQSKEEVSNKFRTSNTKTISMVPQRWTSASMAKRPSRLSNSERACRRPTGIPSTVAAEQRKCL